MTQRATKKTWLEYVSIALTAAAIVEKGKLACIDTATGLLVNGAASPTLVPIGYWDEDATGDGTTPVRVRLFQGVWIHWFDNDGTTPVVATDLLRACFIKDATTVSGDGAGRTVAGRVWAISSADGVGVEMDGFSADADPNVAPQSIVSGDYVPALTDVTNIDASALLDARYMRIGNIVTVFFGVTIDATAAAATELGIGLPVASNFAAANDLLGMAVSSETVGAAAQVSADVANDRASLTFTAVGTGVVTWRGSFSYLVI
jgi:hypothetical protein